MTLLPYMFRPCTRAQVSDEDSESVGKSTLYHEPFNVNMYTTSAAVAHSDNALHAPLHHHLNHHALPHAHQLHQPSNISHLQQQQQQKLLHLHQQQQLQLQQQKQQQHNQQQLQSHQQQHITPDYTDVPDIMCQEYASTNMQEIIAKLPDNYLTSKYLSAASSHNQHHQPHHHHHTIASSSLAAAAAAAASSAATSTSTSANKTTPNVPTSTTTNTITPTTNKHPNASSTLPHHHLINHPSSATTGGNHLQQLQSATLSAATGGGGHHLPQHHHADKAGGKGKPTASTIFKHQPTNNFYFDVDSSADVAASLAAVGTANTTAATTTSTTPTSTIKEFSRHSLVIVEKLGVGQHGEFHLCETKEPSHRLVAVATLRPGATGAARTEFVRTAERLGRLRHTNVAALAGACLLDEPICFVVNFSAFRGELTKYLQEHKPAAGQMLNSLMMMPTDDGCGGGRGGLR